MSEDKKEQITRICIEMDPTTKEWVTELEKKYNCASHRELFFLALKFVDETPYDKLPFEIRGIVQSKGAEVPRDNLTIRRMQIERLHKEIDNYVIRTNKDKEILTKMIGELRKLLLDDSRDRASKMLEELKELKEKMEQ